MKNIKVIAFDADDTLWVNEPYFLEAEQKFCALLEDYLPHHSVSQELFKTEMQNLSLYGYGVKSFMLCMIETVLRVTNNTANPEILHKTIQYGQELLNKPIELLDDVKEILEALKGKYRLVVATKSDLLDQERKLAKSGLSAYFHHIEIMSDKKVGNSLKSDVMPVLEIGGHAVHIPYHTTWAHEQIDHTLEHDNFYQVKALAEILPQLL